MHKHHNEKGWVAIDAEGNPEYFEYPEDMKKWLDENQNLSLTYHKADANIITIIRCDLVFKENPNPKKKKKEKWVFDPDLCTWAIKTSKGRGYYSVDYKYLVNVCGGANLGTILGKMKNNAMKEYKAR